MTSRARGRCARSRLLARVAGPACAALALAGCGLAPQAGAAAVVGDTRIGVTELQTATSQINEATGQDGAIAAATVLGWMMVAPFVLDAAADADAVASDVDACLVLQGAAAAQTEGQDGADEGACTSGAIDDYATATLLAVRSYLSAGNTAQGLADLPAVGEWWDGILDQVEADGVDVNPRFGQYTRTDAGEVQSLDGLLAIVGPASPNWIVTPTPSPSQPAVPQQSPSPSPTPTQ